MVERTQEQEAEIRKQLAQSEASWQRKELNRKSVKAAVAKSVRMKIERDQIAFNFNTGVAKAAAKIRSEEPDGAGYEYHLMSKAYRRESPLDKL